VSRAAILSLRDFAARVGVPLPRLLAIADDIRPHYRAQPLRDKKTGAVVRQLQVPDDELMEVQKRIVKNIINPIGFSDLAHGGVRGRSPRTNAAAHLGQRWLVTVDVREFFPNVQHKVVYGMFCDLGFGRHVANLLTRLVTHRGYLPQGSPSSTAVANLVLKKVDGVAERLAPRAGSKATRFVDDVAASGAVPKNLIGPIARELSRSNLSIHRGLSKSGKPKLKVVPNWARQEVTGLVVNSTIGPTVSRAKRDRIRAEVHKLPCDAGDVREKAIRSLRGKIQHVRQFNPGSGDRLVQQLEIAIKSTPAHRQ
jgi:hypothetical protein